MFPHLIEVFIYVFLLPIFSLLFIKTFLVKNAFDKYDFTVHKTYLFFEWLKSLLCSKYNLSLLALFLPSIATAAEEAAEEVKKALA